MQILACLLGVWCPPLAARSLPQYSFPQGPSLGCGSHKAALPCAPASDECLYSPCSWVQGQAEAYLEKLHSMAEKKLKSLQVGLCLYPLLRDLPWCSVLTFWWQSAAGCAQAMSSENWLVHPCCLQCISVHLHSMLAQAKPAVLRSSACAIHTGICSPPWRSLAAASQELRRWLRLWQPQSGLGSARP